MPHILFPSTHDKYSFSGENWKIIIWKPNTVIKFKFLPLESFESLFGFLVISHFPGNPSLSDHVCGVWRKFASFVRHAGDAAAQKLNRSVDRNTLRGAAMGKGIWFWDNKH